MSIRTIYKKPALLRWEAKNGDFVEFAKGFFDMAPLSSVESLAKEIGVTPATAYGWLRDCGLVLGRRLCSLAELSQEETANELQCAPPEPIPAGV